MCPALRVGQNAAVFSCLNLMRSTVGDVRPKSQVSERREAWGEPLEAKLRSDFRNRPGMPDLPVAAWATKKTDNPNGTTLDRFAC